MLQNGHRDSLNFDRDPKFVSRFFSELMYMCSVKIGMSSARHPQTNEASEVMSRVLENYLRCDWDHKQKDWDILLRAAELAYNPAVSKDLGILPYETDLGWRFQDSSDKLGETTLVQAVEDFAAGLQSAFKDARYAHTLAKARRSAEEGLHSRQPSHKVEITVWVTQNLWVDQYNETRPFAKLSARLFGLFRTIKLVRKSAVCLEFLQHIKRRPVVYVSLTKPAISKLPH